MLPFLKKDQSGSVSLPVETHEMESRHDEQSDYDMIDRWAQDLIDAIPSGDVRKTSEVLRALMKFVILRLTLMQTRGTMGDATSEIKVSRSI